MLTEKHIKPSYSGEGHKETTVGDDERLEKVNSIEQRPTFYCGESTTGDNGSRSASISTNEDGENVTTAAMNSTFQTQDSANVQFQSHAKNQARNASNPVFQYYSMESIQQKQDKEPLEDFEVFRQELEKITGCCRKTRIRKAHRWNIQATSSATVTNVDPFAQRLQVDEIRVHKVRRRSRSASSFKELKKILGFGQTVDRGCGEMCINCDTDSNQLLEEHTHRHQRHGATACSSGSANESDVNVDAPAEPHENNVHNCQTSAETVSTKNESIFATSSVLETPQNPTCSTAAQLLGEFYTENYCSIFDIIKTNDNLCDSDEVDDAARSTTGDFRCPSSSQNESLAAEKQLLSDHSRIIALKQNLDMVLSRQKKEMSELLIRQEIEWIQLEMRFGPEKIREFRRRRMQDKMAK